MLELNFEIGNLALSIIIKSIPLNCVFFIAPKEIWALFKYAIGFELSEDEKRLYNRNLARKGNHTLNQTAKKSGVKNFDKFHNYGYKGLYNGETANDIAKRKGLRYREEILDNMGSEELVDNLFRITLTNQKIRNENVNGEKNAVDAHYDVGLAVRDTIKK